MDKSSESQGGLSLRWRLITAGVWAGLGKALSAFGGFLVFLIVSKDLPVIPLKGESEQRGDDRPTTLYVRFHVDIALSQQKEQAR